jgi:hypothetical protein
MAYMNLDELHQIMLEGPIVTGVHLLVDQKHRESLYRELKETPAVSGVLVKEHAIQSFENTVGENMGIMRRINLMFAYIVSGTEPRAGDAAGDRVYAAGDFQHSVGRIGRDHLDGVAAGICGRPIPGVVDGHDVRSGIVPFPVGDDESHVRLVGPRDNHGVHDFRTCRATEP